ncbi:hypothetical protein GGS21DRAFT_546770 [Xylaria nigripes]|nr:hypothetical protein GGS21DRAFT_546770 [Xylaria nigripes]
MEPDFNFSPYTGRKPGKPQPARLFNVKNHGTYRDIERQLHEQRVEARLEEAQTQAVEKAHEEERREYDVAFPPQVVQEFQATHHLGRVPPSINAIPEEFLCCHCGKIIRRDENDSPWAC